MEILVHVTILLVRVAAVQRESMFYAVTLFISWQRPCLTVTTKYGLDKWVVLLDCLAGYHLAKGEWAIRT
jgi:hypothetical protein